MKNHLRFLFVFILLAAIDQLLKFFLGKNAICNKNIAWSIRVAPAIFYFAWIVIIYFILSGLSRSQNLFQKIGYVLILSGAVSNMIDRISHGCVIDFIDIKIWPVFNLADIYITIGLVILIGKFLKMNRPA